MAHYINTETMQYQISEADIRALYPQTSFPNPFVPPEHYALVFPAPQPVFDTITEVARETLPELTTLGHWEQRWTVVPKFTEYTDSDNVVHTVAEQLASQAEAARVAAVPNVVSMRQARLALLQENLLDTVNTSVSTMSVAMQISWEYSTEVDRLNAFVLELKTNLNWTDDSLEALFILAKSL